jgi:hypothetical protein
MHYSEVDETATGSANARSESFPSRFLCSASRPRRGRHALWADLDDDALFAGSDPRVSVPAEVLLASMSLPRATGRIERAQLRQEADVFDRAVFGDRVRPR